MKVKAGIAKLGAGSQSTVKIKLYSGTEITGYLQSFSEEGFSVTDKNANTTYVSYAEVKQVVGRNNLSGRKIWLGIAFAAMILAFIAIAVSDDGV